MKNIYILGLIIFSYVSVQAQSIEGVWKGDMKIGNQSLGIIFQIEKENDQYKTMMYVPQQTDEALPVGSTEYQNNTLKIAVEEINFVYVGTLKNNIFEGQVTQHGMSFPLQLEKDNTATLPTEKRRPQELEIQASSYESVEVQVENSVQNVTLAGTFTYPKNVKKAPAVLLVSGSGPQDRDGTILGHKPFLIIADYLTRKGIAVLRLDDRGTDKSTGDFTSATTSNFATDANAAVNFLKKNKYIKTSKIGIIGHSEGGLIAPMVASENSNVDFIVLLAAPGLPGNEILLAQERKAYEMEGMTAAEIEDLLSENESIFQWIVNGASHEELDAKIKEKFPERMNDSDFNKLFMKQVHNPWLQNFLKIDPKEALSKVSVPVLALNGAKDIQVSAKENLAVIQETLNQAGNKNVEVKTFPKLNHLFQEAETGMPVEYKNIEQTFAPEVLELMAVWINKQ